MVGYSWGGLLAFEAARQLTLAGMPPPYVGLIGTAPPARAQIARRSSSASAAMGTGTRVESSQEWKVEIGRETERSFPPRHTALVCAGSCS